MLFFLLLLHPTHRTGPHVIPSKQLGRAVEQDRSELSELKGRVMQGGLYLNTLPNWLVLILGSLCRWLSFLTGGLASAYLCLWLAFHPANTPGIGPLQAPKR